jgi:hypothetical protein
VSTRGARIWPWVPGGLLASMLTGLGTLAVIATNDPGFALERDYYRKAVRYDREVAQRTENARLGWKLGATLSRDETGGTTSLLVTAEDPHGPLAGARVTVEAIENARASTVYDLTLVEGSRGSYRGSLPSRRGGLWELRLRADRGSERFTQVARVNLPENSK